MNDSVDALGRDLFILSQRLLEAQMARDESDRQKERLRETAANALGELRVAREQIRLLEAHVRGLEHENAALAERLPGDLGRADAMRAALLRAQEELVAAHESSNECELLVDSLQVQVVELRAELARSRGLDRRAGGPHG